MDRDLKGKLATSKVISRKDSTFKVLPFDFAQAQAS